MRISSEVGTFSKDLRNGLADFSQLWLHHGMDYGSQQMVSLGHDGSGWPASKTNEQA
jgi:hypothetical protein